MVICTGLCHPCLSQYFPPTPSTDGFIPCRKAASMTATDSLTSALSYGYMSICKLLHPKENRGLTETHNSWLKPYRGGFSGFKKSDIPRGSKERPEQPQISSTRSSSDTPLLVVRPHISLPSISTCSLLSQDSRTPKTTRETIYMVLVRKK